MYISAEERMMYKVMKALYDSGIPISFKGSMVLKACLMEAGYYEDTRHTVDIDGNWYSDKLPSAEQMVESIQSALDENNILLNVGLYRMYGEKRSAGFELKEKTTIFSGFRFWRRVRDSNPRKLALQRFSRPPLSTAQPTLHKYIKF